MKPTLTRLSGVWPRLLGTALVAFFTVDHFAPDPSTASNWKILAIDLVGTAAVTTAVFGIAALARWGSIKRTTPRYDGGFAQGVDETLGPRVWFYFNVAAAVGIALAFDTSHRLDFYGWFLDTPIIFGAFAPLALICGIPALVFFAIKWSREGHTALQVWAIFGVVVLLWTARTAVLDAQTFHSHNCWVIAGNADAGTSTWECAPSSEPKTWYSDSENGGSSRECDYADSSSSGGTIWKCSTDDW